MFLNSTNWYVDGRTYTLLFGVFLHTFPQYFTQCYGSSPYISLKGLLSLQLYNIKNFEGNDAESGTKMRFKCSKQYCHMKQYTFITQKAGCSRQTFLLTFLLSMLVWESGSRTGPRVFWHEVEVDYVPLNQQSMSSLLRTTTTATIQQQSSFVYRQNHL